MRKKLIFVQIVSYLVLAEVHEVWVVEVYEGVLEPTGLHTC